MKTRSDFVSNSSSSSFVIAVNSIEMPLSMFCKKLADACVTSSSDAVLVDQNVLRLEYCLSENVLLHLGHLFIRAVETVLDEEHCDLANDGEDVSNEQREYWKSMVSDCKSNIMKFTEAKDYPDSDQYKAYEMYKDDYVDEDGKVHMFEQVWSGGHAVSRHVMMTSLAFNRHEAGIDASFDEDALRLRVQQMKEVGEMWYSHSSIMSEPRTYEVTMDTVLNTRELLAAGLRVEFDDWEKDLNEIEQMLNEGKKIYVIQHNYAGCGMLSDGVYSDYDVDIRKRLLHEDDVEVLNLSMDS